MDVKMDVKMDILIFDCVKMDVKMDILIFDCSNAVPCNGSYTHTPTLPETSATFWRVLLITRTACSRFQDCGKWLAHWRTQNKIIIVINTGKVFQLSQVANPGPYYHKMSYLTARPGVNPIKVRILILCLS